jgi:hypothetical protein
MSQSILGYLVRAPFSKAKSFGRTDVDAGDVLVITLPRSANRQELKATYVC